jgi:hypothetical protein
MLIPPYLRKSQERGGTGSLSVFERDIDGGFHGGAGKVGGEKVLGFSAESVVRMKRALGRPLQDLDRDGN